MREDLLPFTEPIQVLDHGFVRLVDVMGDDSSIVQAARISYGKGTKTVREDRGLIRYLMRGRHTSPFEMCDIKLHIKAPMDTWRQWIRHRTASVNEYSTRYSEAIDEKQRTAPDEWRLQSNKNKQGSEEGVLYWPEEFICPTKTNMSPEEFLSQRERAFQRDSQKLYKERLEFGIAREQARKDLPLSTYTEAYWKIDLHNLLHFLSLRMDSHAQKEIRDYAHVVAEIVKVWVPITWEAFEDYRLNGTSFSGLEMDVLRELVSLLPPDSEVEALESRLEEVGLSKREIREFREKLSVV